MSELHAVGHLAETVLKQRLPVLKLDRKSWAAYREEKIDSGLFHLFRRTLELFDEMFAHLKDQLTKCKARCVLFLIFNYRSSL